MPVLETRRPRSGLAGSALITGRTTRSEPLDRTPGMSSRTSPAARRARSSKSGRNPRGLPVGAGAQDGSWGAGDSSSAPQDAGPQPARNRPLSICKWPGRTRINGGTGPRRNTEGARWTGSPGSAPDGKVHPYHEGFTGRQTEHRLRTVVGAKMGPRPVCGPLRPLCARPRHQAWAQPADPSPSLSCAAHARGPGGGAAQAQTPLIPTGVSELAL